MLARYAHFSLNRRGSQVVRSRSAKPLFAGSIPAPASRLVAHFCRYTRQDAIAPLAIFDLRKHEATPISTENFHVFSRALRQIRSTKAGVSGCRPARMRGRSEPAAIILRASSPVTTNQRVGRCGGAGGGVGPSWGGGPLSLEKAIVTLPMSAKRTQYKHM